jgi:hypothetical protein
MTRLLPAILLLVPLVTIAVVRTSCASESRAVAR